MIKKTSIRKNNAFTLIELLAVIVIIAVLAAISIPRISKYVVRARTATFANNANVALNAFRNYVVTNSINLDFSMSLEDLNALLDKPLIESPFGKAYQSYSTLYVIFDENHNQIYKICLVDGGGNGMFTGSGTAILEEDATEENVELGSLTVEDCSL